MMPKIPTMDEFRAMAPEDAYGLLHDFAEYAGNAKSGQENALVAVAELQAKLDAATAAARDATEKAASDVAAMQAQVDEAKAKTAEALAARDAAEAVKAELLGKYDEQIKAEQAAAARAEMIASLKADHAAKIAQLDALGFTEQSDALRAVPAIPE
jgi:hypothetical protein